MPVICQKKSPVEIGLRYVNYFEALQFFNRSGINEEAEPSFLQKRKDTEQSDSSYYRATTRSFSFSRKHLSFVPVLRCHQ